MAKLYEIRAEIEECIDLETGEILDLERLTALKMDEQEKLEGVALAIKNLKAEAAAIDEELKAFEARKKHIRNRIDGLSGWLAMALNGKKFETAKAAVSFRRSRETKIEPKHEGDVISFLETEGHFECLKYGAPSVNKTELKKLLDDGVEVPFASVIEKINAQVK